MDFKGFLKNEYHSRNVDLQSGDHVYVRNIAWTSFGYGETEDNEGNLLLRKLTDGEPLIRNTFNHRQSPFLVNFTKLAQCTPLQSLNGPNIKYEGDIAIQPDLKKNCVTLAKTYLIAEAARYYEHLAIIQCEN